MQQEFIINRQSSIVNRQSSIVNRPLSVFAPLHLSRILYKSALFMQNKPNCRKAKMNINSLITKDYRKKDDFVVRINKPNFVKGPK